MTSRAFLILFLLVSQPVCVIATTVTIITDPPGASVEVEGRTGTTPFEMDLPGGYFHEPLSLLGKHLSRPLVAHIKLEGYESQEVPLTLGPREWVSSNGHKRYQYYVLSSTHFVVRLKRPFEAVPETIALPKATSAKTMSSADGVEGSVLENCKNAVVRLHGPLRNGSGFFARADGLIATNAHVVDAEMTVFADLANEETRLEARVVYKDPNLDIAFLRVKKGVYPYLKFGNLAAVKQGSSAITIGSPKDAMPFSVTKGVVSAIGPFPEIGRGTWIQIDASINPGVSGGPLLNADGEVIGISTQKVVKEGVSGIGFALSSFDLLASLNRYDESRDATRAMAEEKNAGEDKGTLVFSEPAGASIVINDVVVGRVPMTLTLVEGLYRVWVLQDGAAIYGHITRVSKGGTTVVTPEH